MKQLNEIKYYNFRKDNLSFEKQLLLRVINDLIDDFVGQYENYFLDNDDTDTIIYIDSVYGYVKHELMNTNQKYVHTYRNNIIERKHIKFLGNDYIESAICYKLYKNYKSNGWDLPESDIATWMKDFEEYWYKLDEEYIQSKLAENKAYYYISSYIYGKLAVKEVGNKHFTNIEDAKKEVDYITEMITKVANECTVKIRTRIFE